MPQVAMLIPPDPQFFDSDGNPLSGGVLYFYEPGTSTPKAVYANSAGTISSGTSVTLDSSGRAKVWLDGYYKVILQDSLGNQIWSEDNVSSAFSPLASTPVTFSQWAVQADVLTYLNATQFSVPGDKTTAYIVGNRIQATVTAGTITGTITAASAGGSPIITTVTVLWDLTYALDAGLSAVSVGIVSAIASGLPIQVPLGAILDWYKSMTGVPALPWGWVQCDGQTLSDALSPMNGQAIPNLNGAASGVDTFSNGKLAVFIRGGTTSGVYSADAIKAHTHGTSAITAADHTHGPGTLSTDTAANHTHVVNIYKQFANAATGAGVSNLWQDVPDGSNTVTSNAGGTHSHAVDAGITAASGALALSGSTDDNGVATETIPKTVTAVKIMRVK